MPEPRVLIVCESASAAFGGEAVLPLHYFRLLRKRGVPVWLVTHARTRSELAELFPGDSAIRYVEDTPLNRAMWKWGQHLPPRLSNFTLGFVSRLATQLAQRSLARQLVRDERITVVHQPVPVSPREPSLMFDLGAPVIIGPMNGGMDYPPGFRQQTGSLEAVFMRLGRFAATALNRLVPGKRRAALLLVANQRTRAALPRGVSTNVEELVENGVDLQAWRAVPGSVAATTLSVPTQFIYLGRLVDWKCVDLLIEAFSRAAVQKPMTLTIIGDGDERPRLEALAASLVAARGISSKAASLPIAFTGWQPQSACAERLQGADCLVLPSIYECGGAVVLEAMSLGKPVIATDWGGPADYLDATCGILVAPSGRSAFVDGLCGAMVRMAGSPAERARMGTAGLAKVRALYDWDAKIETMLGHYRSVEKFSDPATPSSARRSAPSSA